MDNYRALYKTTRPGAGTLRDEKRVTTLRQQKKKREDTFFGRRKITESQEPSTSAGPSPTRPQKLKETRREKLLRWKVEKEKLLAQQKLAHKNRPPFKVGVAHHPIDPKADFLPIHASTVKCNKAFKTNAATNRKEKLPTAATSALAALSVPDVAQVEGSSYSGRVTRSRAAAATLTTSTKPAPRTQSIQESKVDFSRLKATSKPGSSKSASVAIPDGSNNKCLASTRSKIKSIPSTVSSARNKASSSKVVTASQSKSGKTDLKTSFAPKGHKFKAPANLTLPTTPLTLRRKAVGLKGAIWPHIPGVSLLDNSPLIPSHQSSKSQNSVVASRRGRLVRAVKEQTAPKPQLKKCTNAKSQSPRMSVSYQNTSSGIFTVSEKLETVTSTLEQAAGLSLAPEISTNEQELTRTPSKPAGASEDLNNTSSSRSIRNSKRSNKKGLKVRGKENTPSKSDEKCLESLSISLQENDTTESVKADTRRMSIHEPSPPVVVSPELLSKGMVAAQFSPFITSARGKDKYSIQKRRSSLIFMSPRVSPEELVRSNQVEHFRNLLERESSRLLTLSAMWEEIGNEAPSHIQDKILGPVGQARLLVNDKFNRQFRKLIDNFEIGNEEAKMTADDLTGFWEMMLLTVENIDKRFKDLEDLRQNNWEEVKSDIISKKVVSTSNLALKLPKSRTQAQSRLKGIIEEARKRKQEIKRVKSTNNAAVSNDVPAFDGGFFKVESPNKLEQSPKMIARSSARGSPKLKPSTPYRSERRSLLQQVLTYSAVCAQKSPLALNKSLPLPASPKVVGAQIRAAQLGRRMSESSCDDSFTLEPSSPSLHIKPSRSILKSGSRRINTPRNRVAFETSTRSMDSSPGSPSLGSPATPTSDVSGIIRPATPGNRRRASLIPRLIPTPKGDRPSLLPVSESPVLPKPLACGDLIDFRSPRRSSGNLL